MAEQKLNLNTVGSPSPTEIPQHKNLFAHYTQPVRPIEQMPAQPSRNQQIRSSPPEERSNFSQDEAQEKRKWTEDEEKNLLRLHNLLGNKWADIACNFPERNHNSVKNYFYAQVRKSIRRINCLIKSQLPQSHKMLNTSHISKLITMLSEKKSGNSTLDEIVCSNSSNICKLKEKLLGYSKVNECALLSEDQLQNFMEFLAKINYFLNEVKKANLIGNKRKKNKTKASLENQIADHPIQVAADDDDQNPVKIEAPEPDQMQDHQNPMTAQPFNAPSFPMMHFNIVQPSIPIMTTNFFVIPQAIGFLPLPTEFHS